MPNRQSIILLYLNFYFKSIILLYLISECTTFVKIILKKSRIQFKVDEVAPLKEDPSNATSPSGKINPCKMYFAAISEAIIGLNFFRDIA